MEAPLPIAPMSIGEYTLGPLLGRGGMSEVYACAHPVHGDRLALKLLRDDADGAFHVESAARHVTHDNVVRVIDAGLDPALHRYYIVMQRLDGPDLAAHLAQHPPDEPTARVLFAPIADGMHAVHAHGIVHRDLKPANVMLHAGVPRIVDFGIAKILGENAALVTSRRIGTLGYMAPEQLVGGKIAPSVDVWALGVMLFEAVTGRLPFDGFTESYTPQLIETAPRTSSLATVSPAYDALVAACLNADPIKRPPMAYVARALRGEVAVESATDERVTQDIGAMPTASSSIASSSIASSSIASSSIASSSTASSSIASSSIASSSTASSSIASSSIASSSIGRRRSRIVAGGAAMLAAVVLIVVAATRTSSETTTPSATPSRTAPASAFAPETPPSEATSVSAAGSAPSSTSASGTETASASGTAPETASASGTAPETASASGTAPETAWASGTATKTASASSTRAKPARAKDRPAIKVPAKRVKKRAKTPRRETLD